MREFRQGDRIVNVVDGKHISCIVLEVREDGNLVASNLKYGKWIADPDKCYFDFDMEDEIAFEDLTPEELHQCRDTLLGYWEEWAAEGDNYDEEHYQELLNRQELVDASLSCCRLFRNLSNGYVFVSV